MSLDPKPSVHPEGENVAAATPAGAAPSAAPAASRPSRGKGAAVAAVAGAALVKSKAGLALLKSASLGKVLVTGLSMLTMVWFEAQRAGWLFGVGFVVLLLVHELGHGWAIKRAGLEAGWPVFLPFMGAFISLRGRPQRATVEADIAYAGPVAGTAASLAVAALYFVTGSRLWLSLAMTGFFLNLFNLVPLAPLDGGRVAQAFAGRSSIVGALLLGAMFLATGAPQLLLIGALSVFHRAPKYEGAEAPTEEEQRVWRFRYFGLCFFLGAALVCTRSLLVR